MTEGEQGRSWWETGRAGVTGAGERPGARSAEAKAAGEWEEEGLHVSVAAWLLAW